MRVVAADDSPLIREGVTAMLAAQDGVVLIGACEDGEQLEQMVAADAPDVVVLDVRMPPSGAREGLRLARVLLERNPRLGIVILSQYVEPEYALELMASGSNGRAYLLKDRLKDGAELADAIRTVSSGGSVVDPLVVDALIDARTRERPSPLQSLTQRERQVLAQIAEGKSNAAIAASLVLTRRAVEKHINSIFAKLELEDARSVSRRVTATLLFLAEN